VTTEIELLVRLHAEDKEPRLRHAARHFATKSGWATLLNLRLASCEGAMGTICGVSLQLPRSL
jgi:hypothetical protein